MTRPPEQLAADDGMYEVPGSRLRELRDAEALVARLQQQVADLEADRDEWHRIADDNLDRVRAADLRNDAAEAQVAALTQERDEVEGFWQTTQFPEFIDYWFTIGRSCSAGDAIGQLMDEKQAAEAALADTRKALQEIAQNDWVENVLDPQWAPMLARRALAATEGTACEHEWVDARNEAVLSGELCVKCHAMRAAEGTAPSEEEA